VGCIYDLAQQSAKKYDTRNPFELLEEIGAIVKYVYNFDPDGLKGFATINNRVLYAVINGHLNEVEQKIVAGHEAAHLILHKNEILLSPAKALKDFDLFNNSGQLEYQANSFLADFLVSDEEVLEVLSNEDSDYFANARELYMPPHLLAFKLHSMMKRDYKVRSPIDLHSGFLAKDRDKW